MAMVPPADRGPEIRLELLSSRYFSISSSSASDKASISCSGTRAPGPRTRPGSRHELELGAQIGVRLRKISAFSSIRSMTPRKPSSAPRGSWRTTGFAEPAPDHVQRSGEVRAGPIHLVDEGDAGNAVLVGLPPDGLRLGFDAAHRVKHRHRAIEHAQRALHFDREIDVARSIDDVDAVVAPEAGRRGGGDGDAALLLLLHPVHRGGPFMHFTDLVDAGVVQDALGGRGLPGIDVRHDADVARTFERILRSIDSCSDPSPGPRAMPTLEPR